MDNYSPLTAIDAAIRAYNDALQSQPESPLSLCEIAEQFGVSKTTLANRVSGRTRSRAEAHVDQQVLTPDKEMALVKHINLSSLAGHPPTPGDVRLIATKLRENRLRISATDEAPLPTLGEGWLSKFRKRHPEVRSVWSRQLDNACAAANDHDTLQSWFSQVAGMYATHNYCVCDLFNMDKTGYTMGTTQSTRVLTVVKEKAKINDPGKKRAWKKSLGRQEWVTTIECVNAAGRSLPPLVIYKATGSFNTKWLPRSGGHLYWQWTTSTKGWTSNALALDWLKHVFLRWSTIAGDRLPTWPSAYAAGRVPPPGCVRCRLLIMDGHGSHMTPDFVATCMANTVDLMILPSHSSHFTQPLDVAIFGPMKRAMARQVDHAAQFNGGRVKKNTWADHLLAARAVGMTEANIKKGWLASALWPFRPQRLGIRPLQRMESSTDSSSLASTAVMSTPEPLGSLTSGTRTWFNENAVGIPSPVKRRVFALVETAERVNVENLLLKEENQGWKAAEASKAPTRAGINVSNLGTNIISTAECYAKILDAAAARAAKKNARMPRADAPGSLASQAGDVFMA